RPEEKMKNIVQLATPLALVAATSSCGTVNDVSAIDQATGNGAPSGPHFNLNIIGVDKGKTAPLTSSDRHTIFVALGKNAATISKIYLMPGDFQVCDGNAFDAAFDCS